MLCRAWDTLKRREKRYRRWDSYRLYFCFFCLGAFSWFFKPTWNPTWNLNGHALDLVGKKFSAQPTVPGRPSSSRSHQPFSYRRQRKLSIDFHIICRVLCLTGIAMAHPVSKHDTVSVVSAIRSERKWKIGYHGALFFKRDQHVWHLEFSILTGTRFLLFPPQRWGLTPGRKAAQTVSKGCCSTMRSRAPTPLHTNTVQKTSARRVPTYFLGNLIRLGVFFTLGAEHFLSGQCRLCHSPLASS